ncbi:MAG: hypothetical protein J7M08_05025, partial [Planctomycetes bacterium]|nr:hypothetical protein [Planctomycetota bacterium]
MLRGKGYLTARRLWTLVLAGALVWMAGGLLCLLFGQVAIPPGRVLSILLGEGGSEQQVNIVLMQRAPRILLGLLV